MQKCPGAVEACVLAPEICVNIYIYVHVYTCTYMYICTYASMCISVYLKNRICVYLITCMCGYAMDHMQDFSLDVEEFEPTWLITKTETRKYKAYIDADDEEHAEDKARMTNGYEDWTVFWEEITDERRDNITIDVDLCE